ncbi:MAG: ATP-binding cassette domain-containing protein [Spirochaetales bacterium]|nr:ATP-binding cassette domain-containing protein [Spirochaetales bacterium]
MGKSTVIELKHVSKTFALNGVKACDDLSFTLIEGELTVLMGENGAGKSTLASLLEGSLKEDEGEIIHSGLAGVVHQKPFFPKDFTVRDSVFGGNKVLAKSLLGSAKKERKQLQTVFASLGIDLSPDELMGNLLPFEHQQVELAENILMGNRVILLDEPEFPRLSETIQLLKTKGITPLLITHKIDEALELANRILVMSKGRLVMDELSPSENIKERLLSSLMSEGTGERSTQVSGDSKGIIRVIAGYHESGLWDEERRLAQELEGSRFGYIPSGDRQKALEENWSPLDNFMIHDRKEFRTGLGLLHKGKYYGEGLHLLKGHGIRFEKGDRMKHLSGGNRKKVLLIREFRRKGTTILLSEPSTALDLSNRSFLYEQIFQAREEGKEIIVLTADGEEALYLGDEITPLYKGKRERTFKKGDLDLKALTLMMGGGRFEKADEK